MAWEVGEEGQSNVVYDIERNGTAIKVANSGLTYKDTGLKAGTEYTYRVRAVNGNGEAKSQWTPEFKQKTKAADVPVDGITITPETVSGVFGTSGMAQLTTIVTPTNATNKEVSYSVNPVEGGVTATSNVEGAELAWSGQVPEGSYRITGTTADGGETATSILTIVRED